MGFHRSETARRQRRIDAETKKKNATRKVPERARRDARILERIHAGTLPYTPEIMSWLSQRLDKPSSKITEEDITRLKAEYESGGKD